MSIEQSNFSLAPLRARQQSPITSPDRDSPRGRSDSAFSTVLSEPGPGKGSHVRDGIETAAHVRWSEILQHEITVQAAAQTFALETRIGDDALRFDARPIVAPAAVAHTPSPPPARTISDPPPVAVPTGGMDVAEGPAPKEAPPEPSFDTLVARDRMLANHSANAPNYRSQAGFSPRPSAASHTAPRTDATQVPSRNVAEPQRNAKTRGTETAPRSSAPAQQSKPDAQLLAHLLADTREYRVVLRGAALSRQDLEQLTRNIRTALRTFGFPDLPVIVSSPSGKA